MKAILAGTHEQYEMYRRNHPAWEHAVYVHSPKVAHGYRFDEYMVVGTFWERDDAQDLLEAVERRMPFLDQP